MASVTAHHRAQTERSLRRLDCLARVSAGRRSLQMRRVSAATSLEVFVRRAERTTSVIRPV
jgi:hypothetical protein